MDVGAYQGQLSSSLSWRVLFFPSAGLPYTLRPPPDLARTSSDGPVLCGFNQYILPILGLMRMRWLPAGVAQQFGFAGSHCPVVTTWIILKLVPKPARRVAIDAGL